MRSLRLQSQARCSVEARRDISEVSGVELRSENLDFILDYTKGAPRRQAETSHGIDTKALQVFAAGSVVLGLAAAGPRPTSRTRSCSAQRARRSSGSWARRRQRFYLWEAPSSPLSLRFRVRIRVFSAPLILRVSRPGSLGIRGLGGGCCSGEGSGFAGGSDSVLRVTHLRMFGGRFGANREPDAA
jgi:hypothetical protein